jgi:hypothetical protein
VTRPGRGRCRRRVVGVDVAHDARLVEGEWRDDRHAAVDESASRAPGARPRRWPRAPCRAAAPPREATVDARSPTASAEPAQGGHQLDVDRAAQDGRGDLEGGLVGDAQAGLEADRDAEARQPVGAQAPPWTMTNGSCRASAASSRGRPPAQPRSCRRA